MKTCVLLFYRQSIQIGQIRSRPANVDESPPTTDLNAPEAQTDISNQKKHLLGNFKRSNTISTPHQRYKGLARQDKISEEPNENRRTRLRKYDLSHIRRSSLAKPSPNEILKLYQQDAVTESVDKPPQSIKETSEPPEVPRTGRPAWMKESTTDSLSNGGADSDVVDKKEPQVENTESKTTDTLNLPSQRRRRTGSTRSRSLRSGLWDNYEGPDNEILDHLNNTSESDTLSITSRRSVSSSEGRERPVSMIHVGRDRDDDLESSLNRIMTGERERAFERTQLRRSYIRLGSLQSDGSDSDNGGAMNPSRIRRRLGQRRSSPLAGNSDASVGSEVVLDQGNDLDLDLYSTEVTQALESESSRPGASREKPEKRNDDLRERIRRYKESSSSVEESFSTTRRRSSNTSLTEYMLKRKGIFADINKSVASVIKSLHIKIG